MIPNHEFQYIDCNGKRVTVKGTFRARAVLGSEGCKFTAVNADNNPTGSWCCVNCYAVGQSQRFKKLARRNSNILVHVTAGSMFRFFFACGRLHLNPLNGPIMLSATIMLWPPSGCTTCCGNGGEKVSRCRSGVIN